MPINAATPTDAARSSTPPAVDALASEKWRLYQARFTQAVKTRFVLAVIGGAVVAVDWAADLLAAPWQLLGVLALLTAVVNALAALATRRDAVSPRLFWALLGFDVAVLGGAVVVLGVHGYLGALFCITAAGAYAIGLPRAARVHLALTAAVYPLARAVGLHSFSSGGATAELIALESLCLVALGLLAIQAPVRFTHRVRRARRALAALEHGDFSARLPTGACDDLGFLSESFNQTAVSLGQAVEKLRTEIAERERAEAALRGGEARLRGAERDASAMAERMRAVAGAAAGMIAADSARALQEVLRDACRRVITFDEFTFGLYDASAHALRYLDAGAGPEGAEPTPIHGLPSERVVRERRSVVTLSADDPRATGAFRIGERRRQRTESIIRTPIIAGDSVLGVLSVQSYTANAYGRADVEVLEAVAALAATALRNIRLVDELRGSREALAHQAYHDSLTGLPNRARFHARLAATLANRPPDQVAVLVLDLDGFKTVNDSLGHAAGDRLLDEVARRLLNATRGCDTVARLGGDEFAVLLENVRGDADTTRVAERVLASMQAPFELDGTATVVGASVGIARGGAAQGGGAGEEANAVDTLLRDADLAMYRAKAEGKGRYALYEPAMHAAAVERLALEADLRLALVRDELRVFYQPILELDSGVVVGVEALARWMHPRRGLVLPADFIPFAEETGLIIPLGRHVLEEACRQGAAWQAAQREAAPEREPLTITVNISGRQLQHPDFVDEVAAALDASGIVPRTLVLEITESTVVQHPDETLATLGRLKELGVRLAIDDFGTGYSALSYLQRFPIDVLKLDKAFVDGVARGGSAAALARTILAIGDALKLHTVAEGIEQADQRATLQEMGCALGQGFHFARPLPAEAVERLLEPGASLPRSATPRSVKAAKPAKAQ